MPKISSQYEPLYKQLREQFQEKSDLLDATRRALFVAEEKLTAAKRELEEFSKYEAVDTRGEIEKELLVNNQELEETNRLHREEIQLLQEMVAGLMKVPTT